MVTTEGSVKVVDFGIARLLDASSTQTGMLIGTLGYMAPQQIQGEHADERSDIWAVGVMFYELMCYERPFTGQNHAALMMNIMTEEPRRLSEAVPDCPANVAALVHRMLRKDVSERDRKSTRLNSSHLVISYAVFCLKKKKTQSSVKQTESSCITRRNMT